MSIFGKYLNLEFSYLAALFSWLLGSVFGPDAIQRHSCLNTTQEYRSNEGTRAPKTRLKRENRPIEKKTNENKTKYATVAPPTKLCKQKNSANCFPGIFLVKIKWSISKVNKVVISRIFLVKTKWSKNLLCFHEFLEEKCQQNYYRN